MLGEVSAALNKADLDIAACPVTAQALGALLRRIADATLSNRTAKAVFDELCSDVSVPLTGLSAQAVAGRIDAVVDAKGLKQISDEGALEKLVDDVLAANPSIVGEFRAGKDKAFNSLVGKAMAASKGKANPAQVNALLRKRLGA
jgi:aspartyl-tRNA(Asn)/glutamyl-tRNA(Gln) amidotransferase subunit B